MLLLTLVRCSGCSDGPPMVDPPSPPAPIVVRAVIDAPNTGTAYEVLLLSGERSQPADVQYRWAIEDAPAGEHRLRHADRAVAELVPGNVGGFQLSLTVTHKKRVATSTASLQVVCPPAHTPEATTLRGAHRWTKALPEGCLDVSLPTGITISANGELVIDAGVAVEVGQGKAITVEGSLYVLGTEGDVSRLFGPRNGTWAGLRFRSSTESQLRFLDVERGGEGGSAIEVEGATRIALERVRIRDAAGAGVWLGDRTRVVEYRANVYERVSGAPVSFPTRLWADLDVSEDTYSGKERYEVRGPYLIRPTTIRRAPVPYRLLGDGEVETLEWGTEVSVQAGTALHVDEGLGLALTAGTIELRGTVEDPVRVAGAGGSGTWAGVLIAGARVEAERVIFLGGGIAGRTFPPTPATSVITVQPGRFSPTSVVLTEVFIEEPTDAALWIHTSTAVDVRCSGLATSGRVVPGC